jgi:hypothetical protein
MRRSTRSSALQPRLLGAPSDHVSLDPCGAGRRPWGGRHRSSFVVFAGCGLLSADGSSLDALSHAARAPAAEAVMVVVALHVTALGYSGRAGRQGRALPSRGDGRAGRPAEGTDNVTERLNPEAGWGWCLGSTGAGSVLRTIPRLPWFSSALCHHGPSFLACASTPGVVWPITGVAGRMRCSCCALRRQRPVPTHTFSFLSPSLVTLFRNPAYP